MKATFKAYCKTVSRTCLKDNCVRSRGMITGGGYLANQSSGGQYAGDTGQKTNFGFNVKYNMSNTNLQGNINTIVRRSGRVCQIKGNSMTSLPNRLNSIGTGGTSTFNGNVNPLSQRSGPQPHRVAYGLHAFRLRRASRK